MINLNYVLGTPCKEMLQGHFFPPELLLNVAIFYPLRREWLFLDFFLDLLRDGQSPMNVLQKKCLWLSMLLVIT